MHPEETNIWRSEGQDGCYLASACRSLGVWLCVCQNFFLFLWNPPPAEDLAWLIKTQKILNPIHIQLRNGVYIFPSRAVWTWQNGVGTGSRSLPLHCPKWIGPHSCWMSIGKGAGELGPNSLKENPVDFDPPSFFLWLAAAFWQGKVLSSTCCCRFFKVEMTGTELGNFCLKSSRSTLEALDPSACWVMWHALMERRGRNVVSRKPNLTTCVCPWITTAMVCTNRQIRIAL